MHKLDDFHSQATTSSSAGPSSMDEPSSLTSESSLSSAGPSSSSIVNRNIKASPHKPPPTTLEIRRRQRLIAAGKNPDELNRGKGENLKEVKRAWEQLKQCLFYNLICVAAFWTIQKILCWALSYDNPNLIVAFIAFLLKADEVWIWPYALVIRILSCLWYQDIAKASHRYTQQQLVQSSSTNPSPLASSAQPESVSHDVADFVVSIFLEYVFILQRWIVCLALSSSWSWFVPVVHILHTSLLFALYAFEYCWMMNGIKLNQRLECIQANWPYYFGFGLPVGGLTYLYNGSFVLSGSIFGVLFPVLIISSFQSFAIATQENHQITSTRPNPVVHRLAIFQPSYKLLNQCIRCVFRRNQ